jgi:sec-independent protein translocase protein TatA
MMASVLIGMIGAQELIILGLILLLLFGGKKIPELMKGLGKGVKNFKDGMKEDDDSSKITPEKE